VRASPGGFNTPYPQNHTRGQPSPATQREESPLRPPRRTLPSNRTRSRRPVWISLTALGLAFFLLASHPVLANHHAPQPSQDHITLWAHRDTVDNRFFHHMSTDLNETDPLNPGSDNPGESWSWTMVLRPQLNQTLRLDENTTARFIIYMGGSTHFGAVTVTTQLHHGDTLIAQGAPREHIYSPSGTSLEGNDALVQEYPLLEWDAPLQETRLEPGEELTWTVTAQGSFTAIYMGMSPTRGNSHLELPIIHAEPPPRPEPPEEIITPAPPLLWILASLGTLMILLRKRP
jgi:hypothetical protein